MGQEREKGLESRHPSMVMLVVPTHVVDQGHLCAQHDIYFFPVEEIVVAMVEGSAVHGRCCTGRAFTVLKVGRLLCGRGRSGELFGVHSLVVAMGRAQSQRGGLKRTGGIQVAMGRAQLAKARSSRESWKFGKQGGARGGLIFLKAGSQRNSDWVGYLFRRLLFAPRLSFDRDPSLPWPSDSQAD